MGKFRRIVRRVLAVLPAVAVQVLLLVVLIEWLSPYAAVINFVLSILSLLLVLYIIIKRDEPAYKTLWLLVILPFPLAGAVLYLLFGNRRTARPLAKRLNAAAPVVMPNDSEIMCRIRAEKPRLAQTFAYLRGKTGCPVLANESAKYYPLGDDMFPDMLDDLRAAERYIYVEYFIIQHGKFFDTILDILCEKSREGVDVRVIYDDLGSISSFSLFDRQRLVENGIRCIAFNPMLAIGGTLNYRDHKKILAIDGRVAYTGGINLADEYINEVERFGHWKDIGFRITGESAAGFADMFLLFWNAFGERSPEPLALPESVPAPAGEEDGYALTYMDSPLSYDALSNNLFIDLLSLAEDYAWFFTPYLTPGDELQEAFIRAASRGVDVRIIMPGIPDKKVIFRMSRSYYQTLLEAGVKIYEYSPGFVHAKACLVDDIVGTVGTVNLDYRSLFLHFENNTLFYKASLLGDLKKDFIDTLSKCAEQKPYDKRRYMRRWIVDGILRIIAPLC